jgi:hypothetical protein
MYDITIDKKVLMMWRNYTKEVLDMILNRAKILLEEAYDATLEKPNASFIASFDNILGILIIKFQTTFV